MAFFTPISINVMIKNAESLQRQQESAPYVELIEKITSDMQNQMVKDRTNKRTTLYLDERLPLEVINDLKYNFRQNNWVFDYFGGWGCWGYWIIPPFCSIKVREGSYG